MPDITMCQNNLCKAKETCYRHVINTEPSECWQSFGSLGLDDNGACEMYWKIGMEEEL